VRNYRGRAGSGLTTNLHCQVARCRCLSHKGPFQKHRREGCPGSLTLTASPPWIMQSIASSATSDPIRPTSQRSNRTDKTHYRLLSPASPACANGWVASS